MLCACFFLSKHVRLSCVFYNKLTYLLIQSHSIYRASIASRGKRPPIERWTCCLCTEGQLVNTMSGGEPVAGVTILAGEIYLLRNRTQDQVQVYNVNTYYFQHRLTLSNKSNFTDMTSCEHFRCVYISDADDTCVHRLDTSRAVKQWAVNDTPHGLSVNKAHNVLVTCDQVYKIKEFSSSGDLLKQITLSDHDIKPYKAIQIRDDKFIVCHGEPDDLVHRVCMMSADGQHVVHSHGEPPGADTDQCNIPLDLAVDDNEFVFVSDTRNRRVTFLSPTLEYVCHVVSPDQLHVNWRPRRLYFDTQQRQLYVADNERTNERWIRGHVLVFQL